MSFFQTHKQSPFLRAEVSEIKKHLFDECFEPQNSHDVVLLFLQKICHVNTVPTKKFLA